MFVEVHNGFLSVFLFFAEPSIGVIEHSFEKNLKIVKCFDYNKINKIKYK